MFETGAAELSFSWQNKYDCSFSIGTSKALTFHCIVVVCNPCFVEMCNLKSVLCPFINTCNLLELFPASRTEWKPFNLIVILAHAVLFQQNARWTVKEVSKSSNMCLTKLLSHRWQSIFLPNKNLLIRVSVLGTSIFYQLFHSLTDLLSYSVLFYLLACAY